MSFRIGWWTITVSTTLFALNHLVGAWAFASSDDEQMMFLALAALQALSLIVLIVPYRRFERWAWRALWIQIAAMAATLVVFRSTLGLVYAAVAALMAAAQFATRPSFRRP
ncbi:MAG: hypothetical protein QM628_17430 [Propionicimonas sp.]